MGLAVAARVRAHTQAMSPLRRCVCPRRAVSSQAKLTFVDSLATSRLCHSAGSWDKLSRGQLARLQAALVSGCRCAMSMPHRDPTKDRSASDEVLAACGKLGMATRLALARLRLLGPVLQHGPRALLALFDYVPLGPRPRLAGLGTGGPQPRAHALGGGVAWHGGPCPGGLGGAHSQQAQLVVIGSCPG